VFARLGPWCHDRRKLVLALWIAGLFAIQGVAGAVGENYRADFNLPDVESKLGIDVLDEHFEGQGSGWIGTIVFEAEQGVDDPEVERPMQAIFDDLAENDVVTKVASPYAEGGERQVSRDGTIAYAEVEVPEDVEFTDIADVRDQLLEDFPEIDGLRVELGGFIFAEFEAPTTEALGIAFAIIILIVAFGSVLAMGLPIGIALFGIGIGSALTILLSRVMSVPDFAPFLGLMIGLGVGVDYALLIVTRYREQLHAGHDVRESVQIAVDTAGRSVVFAGGTVVISMLGMLLMGIRFIQGLAVTAAVVVLITVLASVTLLPALLGFAGEKVERTRLRGLVASGFLAAVFIGFGLEIPALMGLGLLLAVATLVASIWVKPLKREVVPVKPKPVRETLAYRWSRFIQHQPWAATIVGAAVLLVLALPVLGLRLGNQDESNYDDSTTTKQAYDLLVEGFGPGFNGPLLLVAELPAGTSIDELGAVPEALETDPGVAFVSPPVPNDPANPTAVLWNVAPTTTPQDEATTQLVDRLRDDVLPAAEDATGLDVRITGNVAVNVDFSRVLAQRMPWFFVAVLALSFLLLMAVFRSLLVPLKAVIMNLLSIGAAYGIIVAIFQWGWLSDLTGIAPGPIEVWIPMMLFAVVFGLSMDYEVFLLSRVQEEYHRTNDSRRSVANGLAATAKVITAAAAIMVVVFGAFLLESDRVVKMMGTGLATAILLDATIVRMLLVPATMELLGDRNWWLPGWLDRLLPNIDVEGAAEEAAHFDDDDDPKPELIGSGV
jgi:RND superfamily putative drug exporter